MAPLVRLKGIDSFPIESEAIMTATHIKRLVVGAVVALVAGGIVGFVAAQGLWMAA